jgi:hypothetical protein
MSCRAGPAAGGVSSGWIGPDGRIEAAPGTAIHVALLARFGARWIAGTIRKGPGAASVVGGFDNGLVRA